MAEEQEEKLYNMPDNLQEAPTGQLLQDRADYCNEMADELEEVDFDLDITKKRLQLASRHEKEKKEVKE